MSKKFDSLDNRAAALQFMVQSITRDRPMTEDIQKVAKKAATKFGNKLQANTYAIDMGKVWELSKALDDSVKAFGKEMVHHKDLVAWMLFHDLSAAETLAADVKTVFVLNGGTKNVGKAWYAAWDYLDKATQGSWETEAALP